MLRKKFAESLTLRIFLITVLILFGSGAIFFSLITLATPSTYIAVVNDDLSRQTDVLVAKLSGGTLADAGTLLDDFIRTTGANAVLVGPDGKIADTGSQLAVQTLSDYDTEITSSIMEESSSVTYAADTPEDSNDTITVTMSEQATITADISFSDQAGIYSLYIIPSVVAENLAVRALIQMAPWLLFVLLAFSLLCALAYSRYITRPIVRLNRIAGKMADLDFNWSCSETRQDEIGQLGRSLDHMALRLSKALKELEAANDSLRGEMEQERELDRQRMAFFSAASHELKTPVTILKGQISGMLDGIGVYQDRDRYLLRSLQVTGRMEKLIQEILEIARMETGATIIRQESIALSDLVEHKLISDNSLWEMRGQRLKSQLTPGVDITGDISLLGKAIENLLSNASLYSPDNAEIRVWTGLINDRPSLMIENTGVHISKDALPHLFDAFYREDNSHCRRTGGSGLGLYLVKTIFDRHGAECKIENTSDGVKVTVLFSN